MPSRSLALCALCLLASACDPSVFLSPSLAGAAPGSSPAALLMGPPGGGALQDGQGPSGGAPSGYLDICSGLPPDLQKDCRARLDSGPGPIRSSTIMAPELP